MKEFLENDNNNVALNNIFKNRFNIDLFTDKNDISIDDNLLGIKFNLKARDLMYLLLDIENGFNISISQKDIEDIKFNTIRNILTIIKININKKELEVG